MTIETIKLASAVVTLITAFVVGFVVLFQKIKGVHVLINSRMDELLEETRKAAHAAGVKEGRDETRPGDP